MSTAAPQGSAHAIAGPTRGLDRGQVHAVAACYFVASFATLGLPPYFTAILPGLGDPTARWAGLLYVIPTVFSALGAPFWGRLADRFGRKRLLLRAQLGLSVSFLFAGAADSLPAFTAALVLQGFLGGTFAASNGYLAAGLEGPRLSGALALMQGGARASLVAAPIVVGALSPWIGPHRQYLLMAVLPLAAAALLARLPEPRLTPAAKPERAGPAPCDRTDGLLRLLYALEFVFVFSTVISFPYLIALLDQRLPGLSPTVAGLLFALPHLCYLLFAARAHNLVLGRARLGFALGLAVVALGLAGHAAADSLAAFVTVRLVFGAGLTLGLVSLSVLAAEAAHGRAPGRMFGTVEFFSKGGAVAAGVVAALVAGRYGASAPALTGAATALAAATALLLSRTRRRFR
ncbi:MFS transporter [Streptomyces kaniharaensis]|uniref:MFS transporter n=1 Tax=Streptomyces kaniharaensis TaxID=212423 RepID=A0A6N7KVW7_9ACTN|nr:MFS transporter [Streptomyces kaniharaensis]MQS15670.1 MFS transporter [Streptomyces kaniharaensis]